MFFTGLFRPMSYGTYNATGAEQSLLSSQRGRADDTLMGAGADHTLCEPILSLPGGGA